MFQHVSKARVRYGETDQMGFLYYGNYALYYEVGRVEALRSLGVVYKDLEDKYDIWMPVMRLESEFKKPAYYDEEIRIRTSIKELPRATIQFHHELYNEKEELINKGFVQLCFLKASTGKLIRVPSFISERLSPHFA